MSMTSILGIGFAAAGALVALIWLPDRAASDGASATSVNDDAGTSVAPAVG